MARTWTDAAKTLVYACGEGAGPEQARGCRAVTGQGDGNLAHRCEREPAAPAWLWLDARAAAIAEEYMEAPGYSAHYARTGSGVNACQQSIHHVLAEAQPPGSDREECQRSSLQGLALFQADRRTRDGSLGSQLHVRSIPHA